MIALPTPLPYIRIGAGSLALCQKDWLKDTLTNAADGTDVPSWMAEDISRGVESFLIHHYKGTVIDSDELFDRIEKTLSSLGLKHVAEKIDKTPPPVRISLNELSRRAGAGYELVFFHLLRDQLNSATTGGATRIECHGLYSCVRRLSGAKKWSGKCDHLRDEINEFLDQTKERLTWLHPDVTLETIF